MADWKDYKTWDYNDGANSYLQNCDFTIQYDNDSKSATSLTVRFKVTGTDGYYTDTLHFLYNPSSGNGTLYKCKAHSSSPNYPYYSDSFKLSKTYTAASFTLKPFWACNNGNTAVSENAATFKSNFSSTGARKNYAHRVTSDTTMTISGTESASVTASKPSITDHGNNTFSISVSAGGAGKNGNSVNSTTLYYRKGGSGNYAKASGLSVSKASITAGASSKNQTIYAYSVVDGKYNDKTSDTVSKAIPNYVAPTLPTKAPTVSYSKSRFTIKENWTFKWDGTGQAATKANDSSPVEGYRVVLLKNGSSVPIVDSAGKTISGNPSSSTWHTKDVSASTKTFTIYPAKNGFLPGDTVRIGIKPYTKNGNDTQVFNSDYKYSDTKTVQNAGIMRVCTAKTTSKTTWAEGQVMIYKSEKDRWVEADVVKIRTSSSAWSEST